VTARGCGKLTKYETDERLARHRNVMAHLSAKVMLHPSVKLSAIVKNNIKLSYPKV
jgi:hypothetical protein